MTKTQLQYQSLRITPKQNVSRHLIYKLKEKSFFQITWINPLKSKNKSFINFHRCYRWI